MQGVLTLSVLLLGLVTAVSASACDPVEHREPVAEAAVPARRFLDIVLLQLWSIVEFLCWY